MKYRLTRSLRSLVWFFIVLVSVGHFHATGQSMRAEKPEDPSVQTSSGPLKGNLVIQGGGDILPEIWERFVSLAGGPDAHFVFIPTAEDPVDPQNPSQDEFPTMKFKHVTVLHTRCR